MDPTTAPFWEAAERGELRVQRCGRCGHHQFYPRPFCLQCDAEGLDWVTVAGRGRIYSKTVVRVPLVTGFEPPYVVAIVELNEGPYLMGNVDSVDCKIGDEVVLRWQQRDHKYPVPVFAVVSPPR
jgi:uncharacterized protein